MRIPVSPCVFLNLHCEPSKDKFSTHAKPVYCDIVFERVYLVFFV